jgi:hypothetical protein
MRSLSYLTPSVAAGILLTLIPSSALAKVIFVGSPSCVVPSGCPVFGGEVNGITGNTFTLDQSSGGGSDVLTDPVLLMIGVPNLGNTFSAPTVTLSHGTGVLGGTPISGLSWNSTTGFANTMTSGGPTTDAYEALGLSNPESGAGNSESFVNWAAADSAALSITATNFGVYVYELSNTGLVGHPSDVNVTFGSALPTGTFIVAYGCDSGAAGPWTNPCTSNGIYATPFTQSALELSKTPEPASLSLFGCIGGLLAIVLYSRRRSTVS